MLWDLLNRLRMRGRPLGPLAEVPVEDPLMEERVLRFQAQVVAGLALAEALNGMFAKTLMKESFQSKSNGQGFTFLF